ILAAVPPPPASAWPIVAGLGGAVGRLLADSGLQFGRGLFGPFGVVAFWFLGGALAICLTLLALGLSASEWRTAGRYAGRAARFSMVGGRGRSEEHTSELQSRSD